MSEVLQKRLFILVAWLVMVFPAMRYLAPELIGEEWMVKGCIYLVLVFALGESVDKAIPIFVSSREKPADQKAQ